MAEPIVLNIEVQDPIGVQLSQSVATQLDVQLEAPIELQAVQNGLAVGPKGDSAYRVWLAEGNVGTEQDFLDSLQGEPGTGIDANTLVGTIYGGLFQP